MFMIDLNCFEFSHIPTIEPLVGCDAKFKPYTPFPKSVQPKLFATINYAGTKSCIIGFGVALDTDNRLYVITGYIHKNTFYAMDFSIIYNQVHNITRIGIIKMCQRMVECIKMSVAHLIDGPFSVAEIGNILNEDPDFPIDKMYEQAMEERHKLMRATTHGQVDKFVEYTMKALDNMNIKPPIEDFDDDGDGEDDNHETE